MKALLLSQYNKLDLVDMEPPSVGPADLRVRVRASGICGSDVHGFDGSTGRRIPPIVMGHEAAGVVEAVGDDVRDFKPGDRVTFDSTLSCGRCSQCTAGRINLCDHRRVLGVSCGEYRQHGAFAEFVAVPRRIVYRLPENMSFEEAALIEAVSVAVHAVNRAAMKLGESVAVIGAGMIGLLVIQAARAAGCGPLVALDLDRSRLDLAAALGADQIIQAQSPDAQQRILTLTGGHGADVAFEVVGAAAPAVAAISAVRKGGRVVMIGNLSPRVELPLQQIVTREISLIGSCASSGEYPACIDLISRGKIDVKKLISATAPLAEGPRWFQRLHQAEPGLMKVILQP